MQLRITKRVAQLTVTKPELSQLTKAQGLLLMLARMGVDEAQDAADRMTKVSDTLCEDYGLPPFSVLPLPSNIAIDEVA